MKRVMIDLETMAIAKNAAILSIGAVSFTPKDGPIAAFYQNVNLDSCLSAGLITDEGTLAWWDKPAQAAARAELYRDEAHLKDALIKFRCWLLEDANPEDVEPWANGTSFDLAILEMAFKAVGLPLPWKFWNERDYRTLKNLFPEVPKPCANSGDGPKHSALADARFQTNHLIDILLLIGGKL